ncbi:hypothetical protein ACWD5B_23895 [Streptomyces tanashiensis]
MTSTRVADFTRQAARVVVSPRLPATTTQLADASRSAAPWCSTKTAVSAMAGSVSTYSS